MDGFKKLATDLINTNKAVEGGSRPCTICGRDIPAIEIEIPNMNIKRWVQPACKCEADAKKKEINAIENATQEAKTRQLFSISDIGKKYTDAKFEDFIIRPGAENAFKASRYVVSNFEELGQESIMLWGDPGNGKTMLAACIHNELTTKGKVVVFVSMPDLLSKIKSTFNQDNRESEEQILKALITCDLLIIDDLGAEKTTDWVQEKVFEIVDGRYRRQKPILSTSNLEPKELVHKIGKRSYDRLIELSQPIENTATSYRREIAKSRISKFKNILGD